MSTQQLGSTRARIAAYVIFVLTIGQLLVATFATGLAQFAGKNFTSRLIAYPVLMLAVPAYFVSRNAVRRRRDQRPKPLPWLAFSLLMLPFLVDVTGNSADLYDTVTWWDDANHFVNWFLLSCGVGLLLTLTRISPPWALGCLVAGLGALFAIVWELGEWYAFIRNGTELDTAYQDTLGDEALGSLGAACAGYLVARFGAAGASVGFGDGLRIPRHDADPARPA
jgi:hypothetical protein